MTDLSCPNCDPRTPVNRDPYYALDVERVTAGDAIVDPDTGNIKRSDHTYSETVVYAECVDCNTTIVDRRDEGIEGAL